MKKPRITLERVDANQAIRRAVPTRARVALAIYDHRSAPRMYRWLPGYSALVNVYTKREAEALWKLITDAIERGAWHDDGHRDRVSRMGGIDGATSLPA